MWGGGGEEMGKGRYHRGRPWIHRSSHWFRSDRHSVLLALTRRLANISGGFEVREHAGARTLLSINSLFNTLIIETGLVFGSGSRAGNNTE